MVKMQKNIEEVEFTVFDTETTGLDPESGDRIVEIAGIRLKGEDKISTFQSLVNPHRPISAAAFVVNKISAEMLKGAPEAEVVMPQFLDFIQGTCLCSYNAGFDLGFMSNELKLLNKQISEDILVVDILRMARRLLPGLERYALMSVAERLGINYGQSHRALSDAEMTVAVFNKFKGILDAKGIFDFSNFLHLFGINKRVSEDLNNQKLAKIQQALELGVKLKIRYISSAGAVSEREVLPKEIRQEKGRPYLVGHCALRNDERTFRVDGILHLEIV